MSRLRMRDYLKRLCESQVTAKANEEASTSVATFVKCSGRHLQRKIGSNGESGLVCGLKRKKKRETNIGNHISHLTSHTPHITHHTSHPTPHTPHLTPHTPHLTRQT